MITIILDTNFLTIPYQFGVDIFKEIERIIPDNYELVTLDGVTKELEDLAGEKGKDAIAAKIGLELIEKNISLLSSNQMDYPFYDGNFIYNKKILF